MARVLGAEEQRWPDAKTGPWVLRLTYGLVDERPEVVGVEMWGVDPAEIELAGWPAFSLKPERTIAIHTGGIRLPLRRLLRDWVADRIKRAGNAESAPSLPAGWRSEALATGRAVDVRRRGGADAHGDDHWEEVAAVYLAKGTAGVANHFTVAKGTAAKWVSIARNDKELLAKTTRGRGSGRPIEDKENGK